MPAHFPPLGQRRQLANLMPIPNEQLIKPAFGYPSWHLLGGARCNRRRSREKLCN